MNKGHDKSNPKIQKSSVVRIIKNGARALYGVIFNYITQNDSQANTALVSPADIETVREYSSKINFQYSEGPFDDIVLPPLVVGYFGEPIINHKLEGTIKGIDCVIFDYIEVASIRGIPFESVAWVIECKVNHELPSFVVDSIKGHRLSRNFTDFVKLKLEGSFSRYFDIYVPTGDHVNVMSVIAPDEMEILIKKGKNADMIVSGKKIWIMLDGYGETDKILDSLLSIAKSMVPELAHRSKTYKGNDET